MAAHMAVAYAWAPKAAVRRLKRYLSEDPDFSATITARVGPALTAWADTEDGEKAIGTLVDAASEHITERITSWLEGQIGGAARSAQSKAERLALASSALRTGNPVVDAVIAGAPADLKRKLVRGVLQAVQGGVTEELGLGAEAPTEGWR